MPVHLQIEELAEPLQVRSWSHVASTQPAAEDDDAITFDNFVYNQRFTTRSAMDFFVADAAPATAATA